jgi:hypothetical protein
MGVPTYEGWLFLAAVIDYSRKIVGWSTENRRDPPPVGLEGGRDHRLAAGRIGDIGCMRQPADLPRDPLRPLSVEVSDQTRAPRAANNCAVASPIPDAPPLTMATLPSNVYTKTGASSHEPALVKIPTD